MHCVKITLYCVFVDRWKMVIGLFNHTLCCFYVCVIRPKQCVSVIAVLYVFVLTGEQPLVDLEFFFLFFVVV